MSLESKKAERDVEQDYLQKVLDSIQRAEGARSDRREEMEALQSEIANIRQQREEQEEIFREAQGSADQLCAEISRLKEERVSGMNALVEAAQAAAAEAAVTSNLQEQAEQLRTQISEVQQNVRAYVGLIEKELYIWV